MGIEAGLMSAGLARDPGELQPTGGRKASGLSAVPDVRIAVDISVTEHRLHHVAAGLLLNGPALRSFLKISTIQILTRRSICGMIPKVDLLVDILGVDI